MTVKELILKSRVTDHTLIRRRMLEACGVRVEWTTPEPNVIPLEAIHESIYRDMDWCMKNTHSPLDWL